MYPGPGQLRLLFTDTDSMAHAVQTDIYRDMAEDAVSRYDFSEYPFDHPLYSATNRKALGFFEAELNSVPIQQFVGMRVRTSCEGRVPTFYTLFGTVGCRLLRSQHLKESIVGY